MTVALAPIKPILRIADICDLLGISNSQFYELQANGFFQRHGLLVEVLPQIDRHPRYSGEPFVTWLSNKNQARLMRDAMRSLEGGGGDTCAMRTDRGACCE